VAGSLLISNMKKALYILVLSGLAASAHAQEAGRADGANTLLAGFDFNNSNLSSFASMNARYSDQFTTTQATGTNASPGNAAYGTLFFTTNGGTFASAVARPTAAGSFDIDRQIATRVGGTDFLGEQTGVDGAFNPNTTAAVSRDFVFLVSAANSFNTFSDINLTFFAHANQGSAMVGIEWLYSVTAGGLKTSTGISNTVSGSTYSAYSADFSSVSAMDGKDDLYIIARITESADVASLFIDNVAIYGTAGTAIPEPSSFAALAGVAGLGWAASRRRRQVRA
jgi:hypothetical protein